jgi:hypothetical protein
MSTRVTAVSRLLYRGEARQCKFSKTMVKRTPTQITCEAINFRRPTGDVVKDLKATKKDIAWRYPGHVIQRAPQIKLGEAPHGNDKQGGYTDDRDTTEARRKHESNFLITLNTNRSLAEAYASPEAAAHGKNAMRLALEDLSKDASICEVLKFGPKSDHYRDDWFEDVITKIEWQACVETGPNKERLHAHIWMTVHHYSQIQVSMPLMQRLFKARYNHHVGDLHKSVLEARKLPYIQVKLLPSSDWAMVMKQYIHKGMEAMQKT